MAHTVHDKKKLLARVRRIRGQVEAIERALEAEGDCYGILQTVAATRGALNGLMAEIVEGHVRDHLAAPDVDPAERVADGERLIDILQSFIR